jgi:hypothetical protein
VLAEGFNYTRPKELETRKIEALSGTKSYRNIAKHGIRWLYFHV